MMAALFSSVRLKSATFSAFPRPADWALSRTFARMSGSCLRSLGCYLVDYTCLLSFQNLETLRLTAADDPDPDPGVEWALPSEAAAALARLPALTRLSFAGFSVVQLDGVQMPQLQARPRPRHTPLRRSNARDGALCSRLVPLSASLLCPPPMQELEINWQRLAVHPDNQDRLAFSLPGACCLEWLRLVGPEDVEVFGGGAQGLYADAELPLDVLQRCRVRAVKG
jgi:hypothetical protein